MAIIFTYFRKKIYLCLFFLLCFINLPAYGLDWERAPDNSWVKINYFGPSDVDMPASAGDISPKYSSLYLSFKDHGFNSYIREVKGVTCKSQRDFDSVIQSHLTGVDIKRTSTTTSSPGTVTALCASKMTGDGYMDINSNVYLKHWYFDEDPPVYNSCNLKVGGPYDIKVGRGDSGIINGEYSIECELESTVIVEFKNEGIASGFPNGLSGSAKMDNGNISEKLDNVSGLLTRHFSINLTSDLSVNPGSYSGTIVVLATPQ